MYLLGTALVCGHFFTLNVFVILVLSGFMYVLMSVFFLHFDIYDALLSWRDNVFLQSSRHQERLCARP